MGSLQDNQFVNFFSVAKSNCRMGEKHEEMRFGNSAKREPKKKKNEMKWNEVWKRPTVSNPASILFLFSKSPHSHRSGLHSAASSPKRSLSRCTTQAFIPTTVPARKYCPHMVAPAVGTTRSNGKPNGGWRRPASLMQASRNGSERVSFHVTWPEEGGREASSARRRCIVFGLERRAWKAVRRRMAVVSLPAVMLEVVHAVMALGQDQSFRFPSYRRV